jgi:DNA-binding transcriptional ArsR family regulator
MAKTKLILENILKKSDCARLIFMASTGKYSITDICELINKGREVQETKTAPVNEKKPETKETSVLFRALKPLKELGLIELEIEDRKELGKPKKFLHLNYEKFASLYFVFLSEKIDTNGQNKILQNQDFLSRGCIFIKDFLERYVKTVFYYFTYEPEITVILDKYYASINGFGKPIKKLSLKSETYNLEKMFKGLSKEIVKNTGSIRKQIELYYKNNPSENKDVDVSFGNGITYKQSKIDDKWFNWLLNSIRDLVYSDMNEEISICFDSMNN